MSDQPVSEWQPTRLVRFVKSIGTSMNTAEIITDAGRAYIKALGNPRGPHPLACEWVGTQLARWFGLPTLDFAVLVLDELDEIPFLRSGRAAPGPALVTRAERGHGWGGDEQELSLIDNADDIVRLVVFDTWTLNWDRHPPDAPARRPNYDNVFLSEEGAAPGRFRLLAADWDVSEGARSALCELVCQRATFVADTMMERLEPICWPQMDLGFEGEPR